MKQTVYADLLLAINFFINYFLLLSAGRIAGTKISRTRLCLGAAFGAACSLTIFLPPMGRFAGFLMKLAISSLMVLIAFRLSGLRQFGRYLLITGAVTFGFGGAMLALWLTVSPRGMYYRNGTVYFNLSPAFVVTATIACYSIITIAGKICKRLETRTGYCTAEVRNDGGAVALRLMYDTGNLLTEPFSGLPVVIVLKDRAGGILPAEFALAEEDVSFQGLSANPGGFRVIPFSTIGGEGMLYAFRPESVKVRAGSRTTAVNCYIAISRSISGCDCGEYDGIINPSIFCD